MLPLLGCLPYPLPCTPSQPVLPDAPFPSARESSTPHPLKGLLSGMATQSAHNFLTAIYLQVVEKWIALSPELFCDEYIEMVGRNLDGELKIPGF